MTASEAGKIATILRDAALAGLRAGQPQVLGNPAEAPARIVEWIDTTVMRRRLTFTFDTGAVLHLEAAGRRLVRLMDPAPSSLPPPQAALFGKALEPGRCRRCRRDPFRRLRRRGPRDRGLRRDPGRRRSDRDRPCHRVAVRGVGPTPQRRNRGRAPGKLSRPRGGRPALRHARGGDRAEAFWGGNEDLADLAERAAPVLDLLLDADTETSRTLAHGGLLCLSGPDDRALLVCVDVSGFVLTLAPAEAVGRLARAWAAAGG